MNRFETHLTLSKNLSEDRLSNIESWAKSEGYKWTHIILDHGTNSSQPMITFWGSNFYEQLKRASTIQSEIESLGGDITRIKVEFDIENSDINDLMLTDLPTSAKYFENHIKLKLANNFDKQKLNNLVSQYNARLSRNARRTVDINFVERFVTQRLYQTEHSNVENHFELLLKELKHHRYEILEVEREFVVYDNHFELDEGWTPKPETKIEYDFIDRQGYPPTLESESNVKNLVRPIVFDPSLRQFDAYRAGEPIFQYTENQQIWLSSREAVLHHILTFITQTEYAENLVLRGSILLKTWLGSKARNPGDIDFVVAPDSLGMEDDKSHKMLLEISDGLRGSVINEMITIHDQPFASSEIWTYEKAPGTRLIIPWLNKNERFSGTIQIDFVFNESIPIHPSKLKIQIGLFPKIEIKTVSPEQSLAWKILWIANDQYAQGKDLYDAVLLAESYPINKELLEETFLLDPDANFDWFRNQFLHELERDFTDWDNFIKEYPHIEGSGIDWQRRLIAALKPVFEEMGD